MTRRMVRPFSSVSRIALALVMFVSGMGAGVGLLSATAQSGAEQIYACVNPSSGAVKIVDEGASCKNGEEALVWSVTGPQGPQGVQGPAGPVGPAGEPPSEFPWAAVTGVPSDIANRVAADVVCVECVDTDDIASGAVDTSRLDDLSVTTDKINNTAVTSGKLAPDAVRGGFEGTIADGSITADDLASSSVSGGTGGDIADGSITGDDVQDSSLTTLEIDANSAMSTGGAAIVGLPASTDGSTAQSVATVTITIPGTESHRVLINGNVQIFCQFAGCEGHAVGWYVNVDSDPINDIYTQSLVNGTAATTLPVTMAITLVPGTHTLSLMAAYLKPSGDPAGTVNATNVTFAATDLGSTN